MHDTDSIHLTPFILCYQWTSDIRVYRGVPLSRLYWRGSLTCLLFPVLLLQSLNSSLPPLPGNRGGANSTLRSTNLPVYKLTAAGLVAADGICESVVFGLPQILRPTTCWKLDWEELEMNQQHFNALCQLLQDKVCITMCLKFVC